MIDREDLILNALGTTFMLLVRIVCRKREALKQQHHSLSYRCRLSPTAFHAVESVIEQDKEEKRSMSLQQPHLCMCFVKLETTIDPKQMLVPAVARLTMKMQRWHAYSLHAVAVVGFVLSTLAFIKTETHWVGLTALAATLLFVLYLQLLSAHICICIDWEWTRSCAVASDHLWMLGALNALTSALRQCLRLRIEDCMLIVAICVLAKALLAIELLYWTHWRIYDNVLLDLHVMGRRLHSHEQFFVLSRLLTIFAWCSRLLWRLGTRQDENELVMLLGHVEYNYRDWKAQNRKWTLSSTQLTSSSPPGVS